MTAAAVLLCALAVAACAREVPAPPAAAPHAADTLRGVVAVTGSEPATQAVLEVAGRRPVPLRGDRRLLEGVAGLEVRVDGATEAGGVFRVDALRVRASGGVAAVDGVLSFEGRGAVLALADGRRLPLPHLPAALRPRAGARVWLAGPLDRPPDSFGVITPAP